MYTVYMDVVFKQHVMFRNTTEKLVINCVCLEKRGQSQVKPQAEQTDLVKLSLFVLSLRASMS